MKFFSALLMTCLIAHSSFGATTVANLYSLSQNPREEDPLRVTIEQVIKELGYAEVFYANPWTKPPESHEWILDDYDGIYLKRVQEFDQNTNAKTLLEAAEKTIASMPTYLTFSPRAPESYPKDSYETLRKKKRYDKAQDEYLSVEKLDPSSCTHTIEDFYGSAVHISKVVTSSCKYLPVKEPFHVKKVVETFKWKNDCGISISLGETGKVNSLPYFDCYKYEDLEKTQKTYIERESLESELRERLSL